MTLMATAIEFEVIGGDVPSDELLELLADILLDLAEADADEVDESRLPHE